MSDYTSNQQVSMVERLKARLLVLRIVRAMRRSGVMHSLLKSVQSPPVVLMLHSFQERKGDLLPNFLWQSGVAASGAGGGGSGCII